MVMLSSDLLLPILLLVRIPGDCRETSEEESPKTECCPGQESHAVYDSETGRARCLGNSSRPLLPDCESKLNFSLLPSAESYRDPNFPCNASANRSFGSYCHDDFVVRHEDTPVKAEIFCASPVLAQYQARKIIFPKCCPRGKGFDLAQNKCVSHSLPLTLPSSHSVVGETRNQCKDDCELLVDDLSSNPCLKYYLSPEENPWDYYEFRETGQLYVPATNATYSNGEFCLDRGRIPNGSWVQLAKVCDPEDRKVDRECEDNVCVQKCCSVMDVLDVSEGRPECRPVETFYLTDRTLLSPFLSSHATNNDNKTITIHPKCDGNDTRRILQPPISAKDPKARYYLTQSWGLHFEETRYCIDETRNGSDPTSPQFLVCFKATQEDEDLSAMSETMFLAHSVLLIVLAAFLLLTILFYLVSHGRKGISETCLLSYVGCLLVACVALLVGQFGARYGIPTSLCFSSALFTFYCSIAAFSWLNIMSFDLWLNVANPFSSFRSAMMPSERNRMQKKKWIHYSLYAFGVPLCVVAVACVVEFAPGVPPGVIRTGLAPNPQCWLKDRDGTILYYYGPIALLLVANIIFFALTSRCLFLHAKDTAHLTRNRQSESHSRNREQFWLYVKLFVMMGLSWVTEVIGFFVKEPKELFLFTDAVNSLQGLFIFLIVACKRKNLEVLKKRADRLLTRRRNLDETSTSGIGSLGEGDVRPEWKSGCAGGGGISRSEMSEVSEMNTSSTTLSRTCTFQL